MPAVEEDGDVMVPVQEDERFLVNYDEEGIKQLTWDGMGGSFVIKKRRDNEICIQYIYTNTAVQRSIYQTDCIPTTHGNLLRMKSWTQRPVDPLPYVIWGSWHKLSRRLMVLKLWSN